MGNNRMILRIFFFLILPCYSMHNSNTGIPIPASSSYLGFGWDSSGSGHSPTSPSNWGNLLYNSASSLARTVKNAISDDEAFRLLGWPLSDQRAQQELSRIIKIYQSVQIETNSEKRQENLRTIVNRTEYLLRVYSALPNRGDGVQLVEFCLTHHQPALPPLLALLFKHYLDVQLLKATKSRDNVLKTLQPYSMPPESIHSEEPKVLMSSAHNETQSPIQAKTIDKDLLRIGWPPHDAEARAELEKSTIVYSIKKALAKKNIEFLLTESARLEYQIPDNSIAQGFLRNISSIRTFMDSQESRMRRIYNSLQDRTDGLMIAIHCMEYHKYVMSNSRKEDFRLFIQERNQLFNKNCENILEASIL